MKKDIKLSGEKFGAIVLAVLLALWCVSLSALQENSIVAFLYMIMGLGCATIGKVLLESWSK